MLKLQKPAGLTSTVLQVIIQRIGQPKKVMYVQDKLRSLKDMDGKRISLKGIHFEHKIPKSPYSTVCKTIGNVSCRC